MSYWSFKIVDTTTCRIASLRSFSKLRFVFVYFFLFDLFHFWGRGIEFSISTFSRLVLLLNLFLSPSCHFLEYHSPQFQSSYMLVSTHFHFPYFHYYILFSISVSLLTYVCHTGPCSCFFIPAFLNTHVSLPYIRTGLTAGLYCCFELFTSSCRLLFRTCIATFPSSSHFVSYSSNAARRYDDGCPVSRHLCLLHARSWLPQCRHMPGTMSFFAELTYEHGVELPEYLSIC